MKTLGNDSTINERIRIICKKYYDNNVSEMARKTNISQPALRDIISGKANKPSFDTLESVVRSIRGINTEWLLVGQGEMLKGKEAIVQKDCSETQSINLYDFKTMNFEKLLAKDEKNIVATLVIPNIGSVDGSIQLRGNSMAPLLQNGDIAVYKLVQDINSVIFGEMYLIECKIGDINYMGVKYVRKGTVENKFTLHSYNDAYDTMEINVEDIVGLAIIKATVRFNTMM